MSRIPETLQYTRTHEWLRTLADGAVEIGISDHAQQMLGDLVFVGLPGVGQHLAASETCAVIDSVKAASDVYAPLAGTVEAVNEQLARAPQLVNEDPYGRGWLLRLRPAPADEAAPTGAAGAVALLSAADYARVAAGNEH